MNINKAIEIINMPPEASSPEEEIEAYKVFFKELFDVDVKDKNGEYKSVYNIFKEASEIWSKQKENQDHNHQVISG